MRTVETFRIGDITCHLIDGGMQRLDGGAMFGVVPKPLWEKKIPADDRNRIPLAMRCLLIEHPEGLVLVDTGAGNKETEKFEDIYGIDNSGNPTRLEDSIRAAGHDPSDVKWVVNTHLHFDHAGGNTRAEDDGRVVPSFPNATYVVQRDELEFALSPNERVRASYLRHNFEPIGEAGLWELAEGRTNLLSGITLLPTPGHVPHHQSVVISSRGRTACFLADIIPTTAHVPLAWIMGYDLEPLVTLETKRELLKMASAEEWQLLFEHDPSVSRATVRHDGRRYVVDPVDTGPGDG